MADCRSKTWSNGRTVLLGDAAAAFLPTAGVGASAAMDSAAALADELSRADAKHMHYALELFEKRQRHRVETAEKNSRDLSKLMFINSAPGAWARDKLMEFYTLKHLIDDISKVMSGD
jgi:2-polyprenyl-6-methoxyphenol hydroxylase-like FAD-dependent oxidoreductase